MFSRPAPDRSAPHEGLGGCVESPRKLRPASIRMALPSEADIRIRIGATTFGSTWRNTTRCGVAPSVRAASMYTFCLTASTAPRTTRDWNGMMMIAIASSALVVLVPSTATSDIASTMPGNASTASTTRWITMSTHPPANPLTRPTSAPPSDPRPTARNPT